MSTSSRQGFSARKKKESSQCRRNPPPPSRAHETHSFHVEYPTMRVQGRDKKYKNVSFLLAVVVLALLFRGDHRDSFFPHHL